MTRLRVVDIETTGMEPSQGAEVIELGMQDVVCLPSGQEARLSGETRSWLFKPTVPCPPEVMAVHHILPEELEFCEVFDLVAADFKMESAAGRCSHLVAHNADYEQKFLSGWSDPEYQSPAPLWICTYKAALRVWPDAPSHGNQALMYWLGLHRELEGHLRHPPHRAAPDAYVTAGVLCRLLQVASIDDLVQWSTEPRLLPACPIGKFRGQPWSQVDQGFLDWMLRQPDMEADLKWNARRELERRRTHHLRGD